MAMKVRGRGISLIIAVVLALGPLFHFSNVIGSIQNGGLSAFWYTLATPVLPALIPLFWIGEHFHVAGVGVAGRRIFGFASALLCWFALAEGVRVMTKQRTAKARLQGFSWLGLFLMLYSFGVYLVHVLLTVE